MSDNPAVVLDNGSATMKAGLAGDDVPSFVFPSVVGHLMNPASVGGMSKDSYAGDEALAKRRILRLTYPITNRVISDWDDMEKLWDYTFQNQLRVDPEEQRVLVADPFQNSDTSREKLLTFGGVRGTAVVHTESQHRLAPMQVMFEKYRVPGLYLGNQAVLALHASGRTTGLVLDSGASWTDAVPVVEGSAVGRGYQGMAVGGLNVTVLLRKALEGSGFEVDDTIARGIKEQVSYVALDFEQEPVSEKCYELPDGQMLAVGAECFRGPELLFNPSLAGLDPNEHPGIHNLIVHAINKCDADVRQTMYNNIVLSGGNTMFAGTAERLTKELKALAPDADVKVVDPPQRTNGVWQGGSILASLSTFQDSCISAADFQEAGPAILYRKFPSLHST